MKHFLTLTIFLSFISCSMNHSFSNNTPTKNPKEYVSNEYLQRLNFNNKELVAVLINNQFFYIHTSGKKMLTLTYDKKPDEFSEGLARTKVNGKIGFFNKNLEIVLAPVYDFAFPFHNGIAEICMGCKEQINEEENMLDGGRWKKINRSGLVIE